MCEVELGFKKNILNLLLRRVKLEYIVQYKQVKFLPFSVLTQKLIFHKFKKDLKHFVRNNKREIHIKLVEKALKLSSKELEKILTSQDYIDRCRIYQFNKFHTGRNLKWLKKVDQLSFLPYKDYKLQLA